MTPSDINVLIHCFVSDEVHERFDAPAVRETITGFTKAGLVENTKGNVYRTTEGGRQLIAMLCTTPFPIKKWVDPRQKF